MVQDRLGSEGIGSWLLFRGYDSTAATDAGQGARLADAFTYIDDRCRDPKCDTERRTAIFPRHEVQRVFALAISRLGRLARKSIRLCHGEPMVPLGRGRRSATGSRPDPGDYGDTIWDPKNGKVSKPPG